MKANYEHSLKLDEDHESKKNIDTHSWQSWHHDWVE